MNTSRFDNERGGFLKNILDNENYTHYDKTSESKGETYHESNLF